jgi:hypothetical protein
MSVTRIVGVHGIRQSRTSKARLTKDWTRAIDRGLDGLGEPALPPDTLELPHWTSLLSRGADHLGPEDDPFDPAAELTDEEIGFVEAALREVVREEDVADVARLGDHTLGLPQIWPASLTRLAMAYDRRFPRGGGRFFVSAMREVRYYLYKPHLAEQVRAIVAEAFNTHAPLVIGHSLGSVIAFDLLRREELAPDPASGVRTLVTCGSPLSIPTVRRGLGLADGEALKLPGDTAWINVYDPGDFITGGSGLGRLSPGISDAEVDNGSADPHSALRYLRTVPVAQAVAGVLR